VCFHRFSPVFVIFGGNCTRSPLLGLLLSGRQALSASSKYVNADSLALTESKIIRYRIGRHPIALDGSPKFLSSLYVRSHFDRACNTSYARSLPVGSSLCRGGMGGDRG
jgi:hypothetical protein